MITILKIVSFLIKIRKITVVKIVNFPGIFPVINSCGKEESDSGWMFKV